MQLLEPIPADLPGVEAGVHGAVHLSIQADPADHIAKFFAGILPNAQGLVFDCEWLSRPHMSGSGALNASHGMRNLAG